MLGRCSLPQAAGLVLLVGLVSSVSRGSELFFFPAFFSPQYPFPEESSPTPEHCTLHSQPYLTCWCLPFRWRGFCGGLNAGRVDE